MADSVNTAPPAEQRGLHPGVFSVDWDKAKVIRQTDNVVVDVPIQPANTYMGVLLINREDTAYGIYQTAIYQRLAMVKDLRAGRHGAYISSIIPDAEHATDDASEIAQTFYNGDLQTTFSGMVLYSTVGTNYTVSVERYLNGMHDGIASLWYPSGWGYDNDIRSMKTLLGVSAFARNGGAITRALGIMKNISPDVNPGDGDSPPFDNGGGTPDYGGGGGMLNTPSDDYPGTYNSGADPTIIGTDLSGTHLPDNSGQDPYDTPDNDGINLPPLSSGGGGSGSTAGETGTQTIKGKLLPAKAKEVESYFTSEVINLNCGLKAAFSYVNDFAGLTGGMYVDPDLKKSATYNAALKQITFKEDMTYPTRGVTITDSAILEEFIHYVQDHEQFYHGGTGQYAGAGNGSSTIEFEAHVLVDLYMKGNGTFQIPFSMAILDHGKDNNNAVGNQYNDFLNNIISGKKYKTVQDLNNAFYTELEALKADGIDIYQIDIIKTITPALLDMYGQQIGANNCNN